MNQSPHHASARILPLGSPKSMRTNRPACVAASTLEGSPVVNSQARDIGTVTHVMMDAASGQAAYVVISTKGAAHVRKLYAVPWTALRFDAEHARFVLNIEPERMRNAPAFDNEHWPSMVNPAWETQIHDYYRQRDYWVLSTMTGQSCAS